MSFICKSDHSQGIIRHYQTIKGEGIMNIKKQCFIKTENITIFLNVQTNQTLWLKTKINMYNTSAIMLHEEAFNNVENI